MVLLDYWIPYHLAWLRPQRKSGGNADDIEACRRVAAGLEVPPADPSGRKVLRETGYRLASRPRVDLTP